MKLSSMDGYCVQYGIMPNCTGDCDFCLRLDRNFRPLEDIIHRIREIRDNLNVIDWRGKFSHGVSLLGGEIYGYKNPIYEEEFLLLVNDIIHKVLKVSPNPRCRYSTVTNGMYEPTFLFKVCDTIIKECGIGVLDVNFSYDLKYRYKKEEMRQLALSNIYKFRDRYNYRVGVQMILAQHVIDSVFDGSFSIKQFLEETIPGCSFVFLYPHPINTGRILPDFNFKRKDFLKFMLYLEHTFPEIYYNTASSTFHSGTYKYGGLHNPNGPTTQVPVLADGKEQITECGHSGLYRCYSDSDKCMLCDLLEITSIDRAFIN